MTDMNDDQLLELLGDAVAADRPPPELSAAASAAFSFIDLDGALAELVDDSALAGAGAVRDAAVAERVLVFEDPDGAGAVVDVTVRDGELDIAVDPSGTIELQRAGGERETLAADAVTSLTVPVAPGCVRLVVTDADGEVTATSWFAVG